STIVATFQVGRFPGGTGGAANVGWATSTNDGSNWTNGFLPGTTKFATPGGPYARVSDPAVAYDAKHQVWIITSIAFTGGVDWKTVIASRSLDGGLTWQSPVTIATGFSVDKEWIAC